MSTLYPQLEMTLRVLLAALLGGLVGLERERHQRPAGLRTYMMVAVGAALFTLLSREAFPGSEPARIAAQIVTGIGFLGAGTIIRTEAAITGLTTAAGLWVVAAIGMAVATDLIWLAICTTFVVLIILELSALLR